MPTSRHAILSPRPYFLAKVQLRPEIQTELEPTHRILSSAFLRSDPAMRDLPIEYFAHEADKLVGRPEIQQP